MTISTTANRATYDGNGATTAFPVPFVFYAASDLVVIERATATGTETVKILDTDYAVAGGSGATGTVTATLAPAAGVQWTIKRVLPRTQGMDLTPNDPFPADTVEQSHDRAVMLVQEIEETVSRAVKFPQTDPAALSSELPSSTARASKYLAFDATGRPIASPGPTGTSNVPVSAYVETLLDDANAAAARATLGAFESPLTTRGDLLRAGSGGAAERMALGASGKTVISNGTDAVWDWAVPRGYLHGLALSNNGTDSANDIDVAAGVCRDSADTASLKLTSPLTKRLDATFAVGANQGGLDTGVKAANTWYAVWAIRNPTTEAVDMLFSSSFSAPAMPAGYTQKRRIGTVRSDNSAALYAFAQSGDEVFWKAPTLDVSTTAFAASSAAQIFTLSGAATQGAPPVEGAIAILNVIVRPDTGSGRVLYVRHVSDTDSVASISSAPLGSVGSTASTGYTAGQVRARLNSSGQIAMRPDGTIANVYAAVVSYLDRRGVDV